MKTLHIPTIHLRSPLKASETACNLYFMDYRLTSNPAAVTCGNCRRTWAFKISLRKIFPLGGNSHIEI